MKKQLASLFLLFVCTSANAQATQNEHNSAVTQVVVGEKVIGFNQQPRLLDVYLAADLAPNAYWPSSRLITAAQTEKLQQRRAYVLEQLNALAQSARAAGDQALANAAQAYAKQIPSWPLLGAEWVGVTKIDDRLEVQSGVSVERPSLYSSFNDAAASLQANPQLPKGTLQLLPPKELGAWQVTIVSPNEIKTVGFTPKQSVREVLKEAGVFAQQYDLASVTLVALTGLSSETTVAYYNDAKAMPPAHGLIFVGLDVSSVDADWQRINAQLSALLSYWNPQS